MHVPKRVDKKVSFFYRDVSNRKETVRSFAPPNLMDVLTPSLSRVGNKKELKINANNFVVWPYKIFLSHLDTHAHHSEMLLVQPIVDVVILRMECP